MSDAPFAHLHCHSHYSLLDGASRIPDLVQTAKGHGMTALALTDHGNLYGAVEFYRTARAADLNPILGYEAYVAPGKRTEKDARRLSEASFHLTLLAYNATGFRNLVKMATAAYLEGFYYRPRIDKELLADHKEGLVCLSGCASGEFSNLILRDRIDEATELARWYAGLFGDERFFIEIQNNGLEIQRRCTEVASDIAAELGLPLVATSDAHYLCRADANAHDVLLCINTGKFRSDGNRLRMDTHEFYLRSPEEMYAAFPEHADAVRRSQEIAERCNVELELGDRHFPKFRAPGRKSAADYLRELCEQGLRERIGDPAPAEAVERLEHELGIVHRMGFDAYFLVVWDFVRHAREKGIPYGARGSACGSLVAYVLYLSHVNPLEYDLLFERFLDPNRSEAPDIDIDFCQEQRDDVIRYVKEKYGEQSVAQIGTFGTMAARAVVRDVGRVLSVPLARVDQIAKLIPAPPPSVTLEQALEQSPDLRHEYENDPQVREVIDIGRKLEGLARHAGTHAAGVVIADGPLDDYVPLQLIVPKGSDATRRGTAAVTTQWTMNDVEQAGLLKMDFLGLRNLTILDKAVRIVERVHGMSIDLYSLPLDDAETYALLARGETKGVFQLESGGIRDLLAKMKPDSFRDIIATNALYRPGPLGGGMVEAYVNRKHGREKPDKMHPVLEEVLAETYGVMVYQEQVMRILNRLGGIELSQAYSCIKAISKKKSEQIAKYEAEFHAGAQERGLTAKQAKEIFDLICHFGGYGFNKSHSTAYALIAYQTAYLKAHYPAEFMAALLSCEMGITDRIAEHVDDCRRMNIEVQIPDVNTSEAEFGVRDGKITYGLAAIKGVGRPAVEAIAEVRQSGGPFSSLYDFCERVDPRTVNRSAVETLIKAGAFDSLGARREQLLAVLDRALQAGSAAHEDRRHGQKSLFGGDDDETPEQVNTVLPDVPAWSDTERLGYEKQALGFYITSHPLARHEHELRFFATHATDQIAGLPAGENVTVGGMVSSIKFSNTKRARNGNTRFAMFDLEGLSGSIRCILWPEDFAREGERLVADAIVFAKAQVDRSREEPNLIVTELIPLDDAPERLTRGMVIKLESGVHAERDLEMVREVLAHHPGRCAVFLEVLLGERKRVVLKSSSVRVGTSPAVREELEQILGPGHVRFLAANGNGNGNGYRNGAGR